MAQFAVLLEGEYVVPVVPATWRYVNRGYRELFAMVNVKTNLARGAVECTVRLEPGTLDAVARTFLVPRELLLGHLQTHANDRVDLDLRAIVPAFVAECVGTFAPTTGANCYHAAANVLSDADVTLEHLPWPTFREHLKSNYRRLRRSERVRTGDLLLYHAPGDNGGSYAPRHVSTLVAPDLVFTKNGLNKFSPYVFQTVDDDAVAQFPDGRYRRYAYRPVEADAYAAACAARLR